MNYLNSKCTGDKIQMFMSVKTFVQNSLITSLEEIEYKLQTVARIF